MTNYQLSQALTTHPRWDWDKARGAVVRKLDGSRYSGLVEMAGYGAGVLVHWDKYNGVQCNLKRFGEVLDVALDLYAPSTQGVLHAMYESSRDEACHGPADGETFWDPEGIARLLLNLWRLLDERQRREQ